MMKRKLLSFGLIFFLTFGLAGCDLLSQLFGITTTATTETTTEPDTSASTDITTITTSAETTTGTITTTTGTTTVTTTTGAVTTTTGTTSVTTTTVAQYTVTFYDDDGTTVLKTQVVTAGGAASAPANPAKASTAQYNYAFAGWDKAFSNITGNLAVYATYTATLRQYTVTFYDEDGTTSLGTSTVNYGTAATAPANPSKGSTAQYNYAFAGWDKAFSNIVGPLSVYATYTATLRQYTVTFYNDDGVTVVGTSTVDYGTAATAPANPSKASTAQYNYAFAGWDKAFANIVGPLAVNATYTATLRQYTVTFYNDDGVTVVGTSTVAYGSAATAPANPTKAATVQYNYAFAGWDKAFTNIVGPLAVNATYTATLRQYTVTFYDDDGVTALGSSIVDYGTAATAPANPTKAATAQYNYAFAGWDKAFTNIVGPLAVNATYTATLCQYTVTFYDEDGVTVVGTSTVDYGTAATAPANPTKAATAAATFAFAGWDKAFTNVVGPLAVNAIYTETRIAYYVSFYDDGGALISRQLVPDGGDAIAPTDPVKANTAHYSYMFAGWDGAFTGIHADLDVFATYDVIVNSYTVTFYAEDMITVLGTADVEYGQAAIAPADPVKTDYVFVGWSEGIVYITRDMDVYPVFSNVEWNRQLLLDYLAGWHEETPTEEQLEADVLFVLQLFATASEEECYRLLLVFDGFMANLMNTETLAALQETYTNAKAQGFSRERVINIVMTMMNRSINAEIAAGRYYQILDEIATLEDWIADAEASKLLIVQQGVDYCVTMITEPHYSDCLNFWGTLQVSSGLAFDYYNLRDQYAYELFSDSWDWFLFQQLHDFLDSGNYYTFGEPDAELSAYYYGQYNMIFDALSIGEQAMYGTVLTAYNTWNVYEYSTLAAARSLVEGILDPFDSHIVNTLYNLLYQYEEQSWNIQSYGWVIFELQGELEDAMRERQFLLALQAYLGTEEGLAKAEMLAGTLYDVFESVLYGIDEGTFDLIFALATGRLDPMSLDLSAAGILGYTDRITALIQLLTSTVGESDIGNVTSILKDFVAIYVASQELSEAEAAAMILMLEGVVDDYAEIAQNVYGEMLVLLDSLTEEKIQIILDNLPIIMGGIPVIIMPLRDAPPEFYSEFDRIAAIARIIDALVYDSGVDLEVLVAAFTRLYYDVSYNFIYDDAERLAVEAALLANVERILELVHGIAAIEDGIPTPAQIALLFELQARVQLIGEAFGSGCPTMLIGAEYSGYDHEMFLTLIYNMNQWEIGETEAEAQIAMYVATFETTEQETFFIMLSLTTVFQSLGRELSANQVAALYYGLFGMGYTPDQIARFLVNFAVNRVDYEILYNGAEDLVLLQTFLADELNRQLAQDCILLLFDETGNLLDTADLDMIDTFLMVLSGYGDPAMLDLSAAGILGYTQNISAILKAI
ncbi:MAG: InlB B-repeat-containing protein, partial [bacterium]